MAESAEFTKGLEGIVAAMSSITFLDGLKGRMLYKGYDVVELAGRVSYEEVAHHHWGGGRPTRVQLAEFSKIFVPHRPIPPELLEHLKRLPPKALPMDVLRTAISLLGVLDRESALVTPESNRRKAVQLTAQMATITAAWDRLRKGRAPVAPDPSLGHAANFLFMLTGAKPDPLDAEALDLYLALLADHDLNASTFTGRVIVSTLSDMHSAVCGALGALKGSLHGGANQKAMEMFIDIGDGSKVEAYLDRAFAEKRKIMGFGHRVYRVEDPRSGPLKAMARRLSEAKENMRWYNIAVKVADHVHRVKNINTNVDFYSAPLLYLLGIDPDLFTPIFAIARVAGWTAHVFEQMKDNRLIRPNSEYVGPAHRPFVPLDQRR